MILFVLQTKNNMHFYDLCDDILRDVYSFGYPNHRVYMKDICAMIETNHDTIHNNLSYAWERNGELDLSGGASMSEFIRRHFNRHEILYMFRRYKNCRCCTRHSYYKPDIKCRQHNPKPTHNPHYTYDSTCSCPCRHMSRHLYSAYSAYYD